MAQYGQNNYAAEGGEDAGSQFSAHQQQQQDASGFQAAHSFAGFPGAFAYGAPAPFHHYGAPAYGATAFGAPAYGASPYGATVLPAAGPIYNYGGAATVLPTVMATHMPVAVRRPGYNERYVAWKNRQKAFNRYKQATKDAIKNAHTLPTNTYALAPANTFVHHPAAATAFAPQQATYFGAGAAPFYGAPAGAGWEQYAGHPYGAYGMPLAFPAGATSFGQDYNSYSETSQAQNNNLHNDAPASEEPEIRGTQV